MPQTKAQPPLISVILPVYNGAGYLPQAIRSVLAQSLGDFELIIINDASTDGTAAVIKSCHDPRVRLISLEENRGAGFCRDLAVENSQGRWITFIDADDAWDTNRLARLTAVAAAHPGHFVADDLWICLSKPTGEMIPWRTLFRKIGLQPLFRESPVLTIDAMGFIRYSLGSIKPMIPAGILQRQKIKHTYLRAGEDLIFYLQLFKYGLKLIVLNEPLYHYRLTPRMISSHSANYATIAQAYEFLLKDEDYDQAVREALQKKYREIASYGRFAGSLRDGFWKNAVQIGLASPKVILQLLANIPQYYSRRRLARKIGAIFR
jgi:succinoglycan biosynthesis protein ExoO